MTSAANKLYANTCFRVALIYCLISFGFVMILINHDHPLYAGLTLAVPATYTFMVIAITVAVYRDESGPKRLADTLRRTLGLWFKFIIFGLLISLAAADSHSIYGAVIFSGYITLIVHRLGVNLSERTLS